MYILHCSDDTFYTGITTDLHRRLHEHNTSKKGAKYSSTRRPVTMHYYETMSTRSEALKREYIVKHLAHKRKNSLINK